MLALLCRELYVIQVETAPEDIQSWFRLERLHLDSAKADREPKLGRYLTEAFAAVALSADNGLSVGRVGFARRPES